MRAKTDKFDNTICTKTDKFDNTICYFKVSDHVCTSRPTRVLLLQDGYLSVAAHSARMSILELRANTAP